MAKPQKSYLLQGVNSDIVGIVVLPEPTDHAIVQAAWAHAIKYSAPAFNTADYEKAFALMLERHPSWQALHNDNTNMIYPEVRRANNDVPENEFANRVGESGF